MRRLPLTVAPLDGESHASYADRLAADLDIPLVTLLAATGVMTHDQLPKRYGAVLPPGNRGAFAAATGLSIDRVEAMLLDCYRGIALGSRLRPPRRNEWAFYTRSRLCPACIAEPNSAGDQLYPWQLRWKLPWSIACTRHQVLLVDQCPNCDHQLGTYDPPSRAFLATQVPTPGFCINSLSHGHPERPATTCGQPLAEITTENLAGASSLLAAQRTLDGALEGESVTIAGIPVTAPRFFSNLRILCALILHSARPDDLPGMAAFAQEAFAIHTYDTSRPNSRLRRLSPRLRLHTDGSRRTRNYHYRHAPQNVALMAAILPAAITILTDSTEQWLADDLQWLMHDGVSRDAWWANLSAVLQPGGGTLHG